MYKMCYVVDEVPNAAAASTNHFASVRFQTFGSRGAYEGLRSGEETREEREGGEGGDLGICFDGGFAEDGETRWSNISDLEPGQRRGQGEQAYKPTMSS